MKRIMSRPLLVSMLALAGTFGRETIPNPKRYKTSKGKTQEDLDALDAAERKRDRKNEKRALEQDKREAAKKARENK